MVEFLSYFEYGPVFIALLVLCFLSVRFKRSLKPLTSNLRTGNSILEPWREKHESRSPDSVTSMGAIQPLTDLKWETVEPKRIYKFSPKYFLTMGLQSTTINHITHIDKLYLSRLSARRQILQDHPNALACLPSAVPMVNELYTYLTATYLPTRYPTIFHLHPSPSVACPATYLINAFTNDILPLTPPTDPLLALRNLALTIDDDFIMLLPYSTDANAPFVLQAYIWCYPAGFEPSSLLGLPLAAIHGPVPGYAAKLEKSMDRYFSRLEVGRVVTRTNWSIATTFSLWEDGLHTPHHIYSDSDSINPSSPPLTTTTSSNTVDMLQCYLRCELQTLFALPKSAGRVLALHLYMYPLAEIKEAEEGRTARELCEAIEGLTQGNVPEIARYKRAVVWGESVKAFLRS